MIFWGVFTAKNEEAATVLVKENSLNSIEEWNKYWKKIGSKRRFAYIDLIKTLGDLDGT